MPGLGSATLMKLTPHRSVHARHEDEMTAFSGYLSVAAEGPKGYTSTLDQETKLRKMIEKLHTDLPGCRCFRSTEGQQTVWVAVRPGATGGKVRFEHSDPEGLVRLVRDSHR